MTSNKPYLIRALYQWIVDNKMTPQILVDAYYPESHIPQEYVTSGQIIFNISPVSCRDLHIENSETRFTARFSGQARDISFPTNAILMIYAKENNKGMDFPAALYPHEQIKKDKEMGSAPSTKKPALTLVKNEDN